MKTYTLNTTHIHNAITCTQAHAHVYTSTLQEHDCMYVHVTCAYIYTCTSHAHAPACINNVARGVFH